MLRLYRSSPLLRVQGLLQRLSDANDDMSSATSGYSDSRAHILARHRDILQELTQEFRRLKSTFGAARDRANLLGLGESSPLLSVQVGKAEKDHTCALNNLRDDKHKQPSHRLIIGLFTAKYGDQ